MTDQASLHPPGSGEAELHGCCCDRMKNRNGRGLDGVVIQIDNDDVTRPVNAPVYAVRIGCPLHYPQPRWGTATIVLGGLGVSIVVNTIGVIYLPYPISVGVALLAATGTMVVLAWLADRPKRW